MAPALTLVEPEVIAEAHHAEEKEHGDVDIERGQKHQQSRADIRPRQNRQGARRRDHAAGDQRHADERDRIGALRHDAGRRANQRRTEVMSGGPRDPAAKAGAGHLLHVRADAPDANEEQAESGDDVGYDFHREAQGDSQCSVPCTLRPRPAITGPLFVSIR